MQQIEVEIKTTALAEDPLTHVYARIVNAYKCDATIHFDRHECVVKAENNEYTGIFAPNFLHLPGWRTVCVRVLCVYMCGERSFAS